VAAALHALEAGVLVACAARADRLPGELAQACLLATRSLVLMAQQIQTSSLEVAGAAHSVHEVASELASGSSQQAASVVEITAAMEELARTAAQIADNAAAQADLALRGQQSGEAGAEAVEEALAGVAEARAQIGGIAGRAESLGERSRQIYRVLDLITEIAQETHMLSLNAAVESAAAGEHGGRFAVVADEVRRLARRSQESVESVRSLLGEFTGSIRATVAASDEGSREAERVLERARAAAAAIEALRGAATDSARVAREISCATQQQNAASEEVVLTLKEVSQVVQRTAAGLKQFSRTADRLNRLGLEMQLLAQSFHVDSPHSLKHTVERWSREVARSLGQWSALERLLEELAQERPFVECLYFIDGRDGHTALAVNRRLLGDREVPAAVRAGEGFAERPWYQAATRQRRTIITPLFDSLLTGAPIFTAATPLYDEGRLLGVLGLDVNVESWTKI
ncbi:MAG TPA: methyl-accepting chemotaxis protein, partial [Thermoanaerobaculia bacterium]|nr:methyl-accepting chemotaxis protein [Thermoanaerobaculia bacterium]